MNNISVAEATAEPSSLERSALHLELTDVNEYRLDEINKTKNILKMKLKKEKI